MNKVRQSLELLTVVFFLMGLAGCDEGPEEPVPTTIEITPNSATFSHAGATKNFRSVVRDQHGAVMDVAMSWSASDLSVFTVTGSGNIATVIAVDNGTGTLTATADQANGAVSVTVERTPTKLEIVSGNDQEGPRGEPLAEPLVARLVNHGGTFIADWPVTFTPGDRSGSVGDSTVNTDREGLASTTWILDRRIQRQTVVAAAGDLEESFTATAVGDPPYPATVVVSPETAELRTFLESVRVTATVKDQNGNVMDTVALVWSSEDTEVATVSATGIVRARGTGEVKIVATAGAASGAATITVALVQRYALLKIYESLSGADWTRNRNWGTKTALRTWSGVETDGSGNVLRLNLTYNNLSGEIPAEIELLEHLQSLDLSFNESVTGAIPPEIAELENLTALLLHHSSLTGQIPCPATIKPGLFMNLRVKGKVGG